ncbi:MAG: SUMF1/EgtB/PvdO family nonheme iron enzyme [Muribaculaceae bacterium]|nr:SUMF1/EgtB/PvdO family nonheme iron enzyme [Muribaculaceae bacterium]
MLGDYFVDGAGKYAELTERLWGDQRYFAQLDDGAKKRDEEERKKLEEDRRRKETERIKKNGKAKETFTVNGVSFTMVKVVGGTFTMGATSEQGISYDDAKPAHSVTLSTYYIGQTEVTRELWQAVMSSNPREFNGVKRPVEQVSWYDCQEFIKRLNQLTGMNFRLPSEAEWEYAARGGTKSRGYKYSGSNNIDVVAWNGDNSLGYGPQDVAKKQPNELGIYDMSGNVGEWCQDWYDRNYYSNSPQNNPQGPVSGIERVARGGSWILCFRVASRNNYYADFRENYLGFRLAL